MYDFQTALEVGRKGEHLVGTKLISTGCTVFPLYQFEEHRKTPILFDANGAITAPDLFVWGEEDHYFVEVKLKHSWVLQHHVKRGLETGFDSHLLSHYLQVERQTGFTLWVYFIHTPNLIPYQDTTQGPFPGYIKGAPGPTGVFAGTVTDLEAHAREWEGKASGYPEHSALSLFPQAVLQKVWTLDEINFNPTDFPETKCQ